MYRSSISPDLLENPLYFSISPIETSFIASNLQFIAYAICLCSLFINLSLIFVTITITHMTVTIIYDPYPVKHIIIINFNRMYLVH